MIASFIDGRVRIRARELKDENAMGIVLAMIRSQDGVERATPNPKTGSVLVEYDPEKISRESLLEAAAALETELGRNVAEENSCAAPRRRGRISPLSSTSESALLGAAYALTAATGFTSKGTHIFFGLAFAALAGVHVYDRRRCL